MALTAAFGDRIMFVFGIMAASLLAACGGSSASPTPASTAASAVSATAAVSSSNSSPTNGTQAASGPTKPATGATVAPCSLLTQSEVDTAVGQPLGPGKQVATLNDCLWTTSDFVAGVDVTVSGWTEIKAAATSGRVQPTSIGGVGDEALNLNGSTGSLLYVRKGTQGFLLTINGPRIDSLPDHGLAQEKVLAVAVLGRLK
jgi:hypothetical protein